MVLQTGVFFPSNCIACTIRHLNWQKILKIREEYILQWNARFYTWIFHLNIFWLLLKCFVITQQTVYLGRWPIDIFEKIVNELKLKMHDIAELERENFDLKIYRLKTYSPYSVFELHANSKPSCHTCEKYQIKPV